MLPPAPGPPGSAASWLPGHSLPPVLLRMEDATKPLLFFFFAACAACGLSPCCVLSVATSSPLPVATSSPLPRLVLPLDMFRSVFAGNDDEGVSWGSVAMEGLTAGAGLRRVRLGFPAPPEEFVWLCRASPP